MKKRSIIITIVLIVIVLLAGFIAYEKLEKSKKEYFNWCSSHTIFI